MAAGCNQVTVVGVCVTVIGTPADVLAAKLLSPGKFAVSVSVPAASACAAVVSTACADAEFKTSDAVDNVVESLTG
jgi:hypothetical protein